MDQWLPHIERRGSKHLNPPSSTPCFVNNQMHWHRNWSIEKERGGGGGELGMSGGPTDQTAFCYAHIWSVSMCPSVQLLLTVNISICDNTWISSMWVWNESECSNTCVGTSAWNNGHGFLQKFKTVFNLY